MNIFAIIYVLSFYVLLVYYAVGPFYKLIQSNFSFGRLEAILGFLTISLVVIMMLSNPVLNETFSFISCEYGKFIKILAIIFEVCLILKKEGFFYQKK